jgi:hypothetical protein
MYGPIITKTWCKFKSVDRENEVKKSGNIYPTDMSPQW